MDNKIISFVRENAQHSSCLLYTSDAADDLTRLDIDECDVHKKKIDTHVHNIEVFNMIINNRI
ncbi:hypothetical protein N2168_19890, partial [Escherichia coli]|nr:hypothetical protein [Escherichia coli]